MLKGVWISDEKSGERLFTVESTTVLAEDSAGFVRVFLLSGPTFGNGYTVQIPDCAFASDERLRNRAQVEIVRAENEAYFRLHPNETPSMSPKRSLYGLDYILYWLRAAYENEARVTKIMNETFGAQLVL